MSIETLRQHLKYLAGCDEGGEVMFLRVTREDIDAIIAHIQPSPDCQRCGCPKAAHLIGETCDGCYQKAADEQCPGYVEPPDLRALVEQCEEADEAIGGVELHQMGVEQARLVVRLKCAVQNLCAALATTPEPK